MRLIAVPVPERTDPELVADRCWQAGASGVWETAGPTGAVTYRVGVDETGVEAFFAALEDLAPTDVTDVEAVVLSSATVDAGPDHARVRLVVPPTVFGNGVHPTTTHCIDAVADLVTASGTLLDVGCGSGILSVIAARLGARATAIDIDPVAVEATRRNAEVNGVDVDASTTSLDAVPGRYDVVVANVSASVICSMTADLWARVGDGGSLIVSGILHDRWPVVEDALGGVVQHVHEQDGWITATVSPVGRSQGERPGGS